MPLVGRIVAALASGALLAQAHGLEPWWPLAWIASIPLLIAVIEAPRGAALLCGAIAGAASGALMLGYLWKLAGPIPTAVITIFKASVWAAAALVTCVCSRGLPAAAAVFVFPSLMAGIEALIAAVSPHGTAGALAYSQMNFLPAIQVASLGGAPAITFVLLLFASSVAFLVVRRAYVAALAAALVVVAGLAFGVLRLQAPAAAEAVRVTLLAADRFEGVPDDWRAVWSGYAPQVERATGLVVLMPEKVAHLKATERDTAVEQLASLARRHQVQLVFGVDAETPGGRFNRAYVVSTDRSLASYDKQHMIPGLESQFTTGHSHLQAGEPPRRYGYAICKDMDFPGVGRALATSDVVFVPAWDFDVDAWLHSRMAMLRGVESGYAIVRSARNGVLTVSDAYGRVLAEAASGPLAALDAVAPLDGPGPTLYARIGDAFGFGCLGAAGVLLGWAVIRGARGRAPPPRAVAR